MRRNLLGPSPLLRAPWGRRRASAGGYGPELLTDGTFTTGPSLGAELLDNGDFTAAATGNPATGWATSTQGGSATSTVSGGTGNITGDSTFSAYLDQNFATTIGETYEWTFTVGGGGGQSIVARLGTTQGDSNVYNNAAVAAGTLTVRFVATSTTTWMRFQKVGNVLSTIDNVSAKQVVWNGWRLKAPAVGTETMTISGGLLNLTGDGTNLAYADQSFVTVNGLNYELVFTVGGSNGQMSVGTTQGGGTIVAQFGGGYPAGTHTIQFTATGALTWVRFLKQTAALTTVDNVSIRQKNT